MRMAQLLAAMRERARRHASSQSIIGQRGGRGGEKVFLREASCEPYHEQVS